MAVFLPKKRNGLAALEQSLTNEKLKAWIAGLSEWPHEVNVFFPRFTIRSHLKVTSILKSIGMAEAFTNGDFSGILRHKRDNAKKTNLSMGQVLHQTLIDVNEEGTEAASATFVGPAPSIFSFSRPRVFRADHPFMFIIYHKATRCILFMGRVTNPLEGATR
jgi:serpin B